MRVWAILRPLIDLLDDDHLLPRMSALKNDCDLNAAKSIFHEQLQNSFGYVALIPFQVCRLDGQQQSQLKVVLK